LFFSAKNGFFPKSAKPLLQKEYYIWLITDTMTMDSSILPVYA